MSKYPATIVLTCLILFKVQTKVVCQNEYNNSDIEDIVNFFKIITRPTEAEPNTLITPELIITTQIPFQMSSTESQTEVTEKRLVEFDNTVPTLEEEKYTLITPDPNRFPKRLPTLLLESHNNNIPPTIFQNKNMRGRGRHNNDDIEDRNQTPAKFLRRIFGFGTRFVKDSINLVTGGKRGRDNNNSEKSFRNPEFANAVGYSRNSNKDSSLKEQLKDFNPIQLLMSRFMVKQNKLDRWREVKDRFRKKEMERKISYLGDGTTDEVSRNFRNMLKRMINWYEKNTDTMQILLDYRRQKLQSFLEIPVVASILGIESTKQNENLVGENYDSSEVLPSPVSYQENNNEEQIYNEEYRETEQPRSFLTPIFNMSRRLAKFISNF